MFTHTPLRLATLALLSAAALTYAAIAGFFGLEILAEIAILAILVIALLPSMSKKRDEVFTE